MSHPDDETVEAVMDFLIWLHDCRDPDMGVPCAWHAGERKRAIDVAYELARAGGTITTEGGAE